MVTMEGLFLRLPKYDSNLCCDVNNNEPQNNQFIFRVKLKKMFLTDKGCKNFASFKYWIIISECMFWPIPRIPAGSGPVRSVCLWNRRPSGSDLYQIHSSGINRF